MDLPDNVICSDNYCEYTLSISKKLIYVPISIFINDDKYDKQHHAARGGNGIVVQYKKEGDNTIYLLKAGSVKSDIRIINELNANNISFTSIGLINAKVLKKSFKVSDKEEECNLNSDRGFNDKEKETLSENYSSVLNIETTDLSNLMGDRLKESKSIPEIDLNNSRISNSSDEVPDWSNNSVNDESYKKYKNYIKGGSDSTDEQQYIFMKKYKTVNEKTVENKDDFLLRIIDILISLSGINLYYTDLKGENLIEYNGKYYLIDFGGICKWCSIDGEEGKDALPASYYNYEFHRTHINGTSKIYIILYSFGLIYLRLLGKRISYINNSLIKLHKSPFIKEPEKLGNEFEKCVKENMKNYFIENLTRAKCEVDHILKSSNEKEKKLINLFFNPYDYFKDHDKEIKTFNENDEKNLSIAFCSYLNSIKDEILNKSYQEQQVIKKYKIKYN